MGDGPHPWEGYGRERRRLPLRRRTVALVGEGHGEARGRFVVVGLDIREGTPRCSCSHSSWPS
jgi:hypothetical protein